jgi:hypothetical protein
MKKQILAITTIASFFFTQILPMDKAPSARGIQALENFLQHNLGLGIGASRYVDNNSLLFYPGRGRTPILRTAIFLNWRTKMLDILAAYHIDLKIGAEIFFNSAKGAIIQNLAAIFSDYQPTTIENLYNEYYADDLNRITAIIFKL